MERGYPEIAAGALILNDRGEVLLVKSFKWKNKFALPGGHIEAGEMIEEALKREIKEETGLDIELLKFLLLQQAVFSPDFAKKKHFIFIDYLCKTKTDKVKLDNDELQDYIWIEPNNALTLDLESTTRKCIEKYLQLK